MTLSPIRGLLLIALAAMSAQAKADIAIQFGSGTPNYTAFSGSAAAAYTGTWLQQTTNTNTFLATADGTIASVITYGDSYNAPVTYTAPSTTSPVNGQSTNALMDSFIGSVDNPPPYSTSITDTLSGFKPGSLYNVFVYANGMGGSTNYQGASGVFTINGGKSQSTSYSGVPETLTAGKEYVLFSEIAADNSGNLVIRGTNYTVPLNGVQVQDTPSPAPEPSEFATLGFTAFGIVGLLWKSRKRLQSGEFKPVEAA